MDEALFFTHFSDCPWHDKKGHCKGRKDNTTITHKESEVCDIENCPIKFWIGVLEGQSNGW